MAGAARLMQAIAIRDTTLPFDRLVRFNWPGQFLVIFAGMLVSFLIAGFWFPFWRIADMDMFVVYNAFLLNAHLPQAFFDHPGYLPILLLSYWLRALHGIGLIPVDSFAALPPAANFDAFSAAWAPATQAGRVLSLVTAMAFVAAFIYLLRALVRDWRIAGLGGFLLAFSGGMAMEMRVMRTELLAAGLFMIALLMLLLALRRGERPWRPAIVGVASLLITLGLQSKVQIFFLICALPVLVLPFGPEAAPNAKPQRSFWRTPRAWAAVAAAALIAAFAVYLARDILSLGFANASHADVPLVSVGISARAYWSLLAAWLALGMAAYAAIWRVAALETLAAALAAVAGCMIGLLVLHAHFHPDNVVVLFHPLETMLAWAAASDPRLTTGTSVFNPARLEFLLEAIGGVIARRTFVLYSSPRPTIFLEWFVIAAAIIAARRRQWHLFACVAALMLTDWGIDLLNMGRRLQQGYFLFTDPLAIIAAALLIAGLKDLQQHRWTYPVGMALVAAHVVVSQAEPIKHALRRDGPQVLCEPGFMFHYQRLGPLPFCPAQTAPPQ
ncbi:MAG TPA: hypothetical protein VFA80_12995 [Xanthobacteraceae bacterium]|nr:hypothetical protein [Xanthobacteraceae bacterium]